MTFLLGSGLLSMVILVAVALVAGKSTSGGEKAVVFMLLANLAILGVASVSFWQRCAALGQPTRLLAMGGFFVVEVIVLGILSIGALVVLNR